jgi:hypothetical protein
VTETDQVIERLAKALVGVEVGLNEDGRDTALALLAELRAAGYRIVRDVETGEANRPGFDARSYEVGYMEGENSVRADIEMAKDDK